ncbi:protein-L-isoaspartate(D-aspartate) O-methyltransferase [Hymenobacter lapidiphilus]|uniref:Protein-L-isoaspartate O-methyltransferase n=1 Tax=Hymenobacter lapidiphilus TaxID=2608003 RepID=A0A7Y7PRG9_9BACT|nr:protein-L-isoaspartate(D-aspartate) O-methyltransferase [Hymenobacter lapidiphilus]NVO32527.1 protein-L-isoaspartate(D-aspartate) O-methyltransferase [Hymenobacter lapidiphilus]
MHAAADTYRHRGMRRTLVEELRRKGIRDEQVLAAIGAVPRHQFFAAGFQSHAYHDKAFPIGEGQTISQPYTVAYQTELLRIGPQDKVLEIGTGSGYQCSVLLQLTPHVFSIEYNAVLFERTARRLAGLPQPPQLFCGDGSLGLPQHAPFDKILVTAGSPTLPRPLLQQLRVGGALVIPVGDATRQRMVRVVRESEDEFSRQELEEFRFVPLLGKAGWG